MIEVIQRLVLALLLGDASYNDFWPEAAIQMGVGPDDEYFSIPRGRTQLVAESDNRRHEQTLRKRESNSSRRCFNAFVSDVFHGQIK